MLGPGARGQVDLGPAPLHDVDVIRVERQGEVGPGWAHREAADEFAAAPRAVLEVRSHEVPFLLEDGQPVGRLVYEQLMAVPHKIYGPGIGSTYQQQGLSLSKHFKRYGPYG